jgi:signal transduction histidine kinase
MKQTGSISKNTKSSRVSAKRKSLKFRDAENQYLRKKIELLEKLLDEKNNCVEKAKSIFLRNLYHEIRTPLNSIVGFSDLIQRNNLDIQEKENYVSYIRESSQEFLNKMDNIIEASIIEAGLLKLSFEESKLYDLLSEIHSYFSLHKHIIDKNIVLLLTVPKEIQDIVALIDPFRLTQILTNLISNSFKFTSRGIIEFGYRLRNAEIEFFIKDTGIGGLEGKENEIFQFFTSIDNSDGSVNGLGLGLSVSKKLVELMGGRIWYKSLRSKGTTFTFTLPYQPVNHKKVKKSEQLKKNLNLRRTLQQCVVL